jgi:hypothetical protein
MAVIRSARGELIDTKLMAIKAQLAKAPPPKAVLARQAEIAELEGAKVVDEQTLSPEMLEMMAAAEAAEIKPRKSK